MAVMTSLTVDSNLESLKPIRDRVLDASDEVGLSRKAKFRLALAVDEVATNIILHGYEEHGLAGKIELHIEADAEQLIITLVDTAYPFDPRDLEPPDDLDAPAELRAIGGLGVFLALRGVDEFNYEYANGKNRNVFIMQLKEDTAAN